MRKVWLATLVFVLLLLTAISGCTKNTPTLTQPEESPFNMIFKYSGYHNYNVLDTFNGTFTKDMFDDPSITTKLALTEQEKSIIYQKMLEINLFNYPEKFYVSPGPSLSDNRSTVVFLNFQYYFYIEYNSLVKALSWDDRVPVPPLEPYLNITGNVTMLPPIPNPEASAFMKKIQSSYRENNLYWLTDQNEKALKLRELIMFIRDIIESKEEYKKFPEPTILFI